VQEPIDLFAGIFEPAGVRPTNQSHGSGGGGYGAGSFVNPAYRVGLVQTGYSTRTIAQRCTVTVSLDYVN
jgi:hypothetical protein